MAHADPAVCEAFDRFLTRELTLPEFEQWAYSSRQLELALGKRYTDLISIDFKNSHALHNVAQFVRAVYEEIRPGCLARDRASRLARGILDESIDLVTSVRLLARLYAEGNEWIPVIFYGIESELDDFPSAAQYHLWEPQALKAKLAQAQDVAHFYRVRIREAALEILRGNAGCQGA